jgi:NAD(P)-dependent dehydrogenase (short-subunit alcohol dehydrogenase family)
MQKRAAKLSAGIMTRKPAIVVTGCSSGIGAHCAGRLRADGWHVVVTARKETDLERLRGEGFDAVYLDYCEPSSIDGCFAFAMEATGGRIDALFNNGAYAQPGAVEDVPVDALRAQFEANLFGWHHLTRLAVPAMRQQGAGRIVHDSSVLGFVPVPLRGAYTASKYALEGLMLTLRQELAGSGIHVSLIEPGPVPSRFAMNTLPWIERFIDVKGSVHAEAYRARLEQLRAGGTGDDGGKALDWCYRALSAALTDARPRPHYHVTPQTRLAALGKRVAPSDLLYRLLARGA